MRYHSYFFLLFGSTLHTVILKQCDVLSIIRSETRLNAVPLVLVSFKLHGYLAKVRNAVHSSSVTTNTKANGKKKEFCRSAERQ